MCASVCAPASFYAASVVAAFAIVIVSPRVFQHGTLSAVHFFGWAGTAAMLYALWLATEEGRYTLRWILSRYVTRNEKVGVPERIR